MASYIIKVTLYKYLFIIVYIPNIVINVNIVNNFIITSSTALSTSSIASIIKNWKVISVQFVIRFISHQCARVWIPLKCIVIYNHKYFNFHPWHVADVVLPQVCMEVPETECELVGYTECDSTKNSMPARDDKVMMMMMVSRRIMMLVG